ncbi:hypothetical protein EHW95_03055 [Klebsiella quasipneumoniae]|nr:hypothetical protein EHW95_03055 [Klebsiella quasipneumoniae]
MKDQITHPPDNTDHSVAKQKFRITNWSTLADGSVAGIVDRAQKPSIMGSVWRQEKIMDI